MNIARDTIKKSYNDYKSHVEFLEKNKELSLLSDYNNNFSKIILLSIASSFETEIKDIIHKILHTEENEILKAFIEKKSLERQYHTLFDWTSTSANRFFSFFGEKFKKFIEKKINSDDKIKESIKHFIELGNKRNQLVHENYALFSILDSVEDLINKYESAKNFTDCLPTLFNEFNESQQPKNGDK